MTNKTEIPRIKKIAEVGENPFQCIEKTESILQGWDSTISKTVYLFKTDDGSWGYFDKETSQVIPISQWKEKAAWINGHWVKMALYHRVHVRFSEEVSYSEWNSEEKKQYSDSTLEAIITMTDTSYKSLIEQMTGRERDSFFKFGFTTRKMGKRTITYVDKVLWVNPNKK